MTEDDFSRGPMKVLSGIPAAREIRVRLRLMCARGSYQNSLPPHSHAVSPGFNTAVSPMQYSTDIYLGRQPILDRGWNVAGYELLFRCGQANFCDSTDDISATPQVIVNAALGVGLDRLPGGKPAFIKFDRTLLPGDIARCLVGLLATANLWGQNMFRNKSPLPLAAAMVRIFLVLCAAGAVNCQVVNTEVVTTLQSTGPLAASLMPVIDTNPGDYPGNIWITDTMQKIRQDAGAAGTVHWGTFYGTQNEFVDFQVHYHDTGSGTSGLSVTAGDFVNLVTGTHIPASTNVAVYRQAYINVGPVPSNTGSATFYKSVGRYPDVLIPAKDPYWGQTTNAWPFNVAAGQNQSAWIDVLVPANTPSGYYLGTVTVANGTSTLTKMPVVIAVWQWPSSQGGKMPSTPTLKSFVGNWTYGGLCAQMYSADYATQGCGVYPGAGGSADGGNTLIWLDASLLMKDHRFDMAGLQNVYPETGPFTTWASYAGPLMSGGCLTHGGAGNTCPVLAGSTQTNKTMDHLAVSAAVWANWQAYANTSGWGSKLVDFLLDEPHTVADFQSVVAAAQTRHSLNNPGIPEIVTADIWWGQLSQAAADAFSTSVCGNPSCIGNSIDVLTSTIYYFDYEGQTPQTAAPYQKWLAGSTDGIKREWWMYQACTSAGTCTDGTPGPTPEGLGGGNVWNYPNYNVDGVPAANRAMEWMSFLHGNTGELYYAADVCNTPSYHPACTASGQTWDPWNGIYYSGGWGDGTLVYAGSSNPAMPNYVGVATPIVLPSIRLKHIRDGVQDYEYLNALKVAGEASVAQQQVSSWITNSYTFETSGTGLQTARLNLGTAMHQLTYGNKGKTRR